MRAAVVAGPRRIEIVDAETPTASAGSVVVEIDRCAIGGSDVAAYRTGTAPARAWFGHAWSGRIVELGPGVADNFVGEHVVGAAPPPCGACRHCRAGLGGSCDTVIEMIVGADALASPHGAFAERIRVDTRRLRRVPEGVDENAAALIEPAAVAAHAVVRGELELGDLVVVLGAGPIGLVVAELARIAGASRVVAVDPSSERRELACDLGCDAAFAPGASLERWLAEHGHGLGADVVFDCTGEGATIAGALSAVRHGGCVVTVAVAGDPGPLPNHFPLELARRQVTVRGSLGYTTAEVARVLELVAEERLRLTPLIHDEVIGLDRLESALAEMADQGVGRLTVLVDPSL